MNKRLDSEKVELIEKITALTSVEEIENVDKFIRRMQMNQEHIGVFKEMRETIDVETLRKEQNFKSFNRARFDELASQLDIEESLDELLDSLSK